MIVCISLNSSTCLYTLPFWKRLNMCCPRSVYSFQPLTCRSSPNILGTKTKMSTYISNGLGEGLRNWRWEWLMKNNIRNASGEINWGYDTENKREMSFKLTVFSPVGLTNSKLNPISWQIIKDRSLQRDANGKYHNILKSRCSSTTIIPYLSCLVPMKNPTQCMSLQHQQRVKPEVG